MTPVLNQGPTCGSCAAHASSSVIESCLAIASGSLPEPISQQAFIDCNIGYTVANGTELARTNSGCGAGYADVHLEWLQETGVSLESPLNYPLTQLEGECQNDILSNIVKREVRFCLF